MSLTAYRRKPNFRTTPEPHARAHRRSKELIFVVQKHRASHVDHDVRLELDRVLKSWAVPKDRPEDRPTSASRCRLRTIPMHTRTSRAGYPKASTARDSWKNGMAESTQPKARVAQRRASEPCEQDCGEDARVSFSREASFGGVFARAIEATQAMATDQDACEKRIIARPPARPESTCWFRSAANATAGPQATYRPASRRSQP